MIRYDTIRCFNVLSKPNGSARARYLTAADARTAWSNRLSVNSRPRVSLGTTPTDRQTDRRTDGQLTVTQTLLRISMRAVPVAACLARIMHMHIYEYLYFALHGSTIKHTVLQ